MEYDDFVAQDEELTSQLLDAIDAKDLAKCAELKEKISCLMEQVPTEYKRKNATEVLIKLKGLVQDQSVDSSIDKILEILKEG